jgi:prevent-host-death family protein
MTVSVAQAKARFSELLQAAEAGEPVIITRHGRPVVQLRPAAAPKPPLPLESLRAFRATMPRLPMSGARVVRQLRDEED